MKNTIVDELLAETAVTANDLKNNASGDGAEFADATNAALTDPDLDIHADGIPLEEQEASLAQLAEFYKSMEGEGGVLTEAARNIVRLNRQTKLLNLTNRSALVMAARKGDPLFAKYAKFNKMRKAIRAQIVQKYGAKATSYARKLMTQSVDNTGGGKAK